jgi:hypothetical protein
MTPELVLHLQRVIADAAMDAAERTHPDDPTSAAESNIGGMLASITQGLATGYLGRDPAELLADVARFLHQDEPKQ